MFLMWMLCTSMYSGFIHAPITCFIIKQYCYSAPEYGSGLDKLQGDLWVDPVRLAPKKGRNFMV
jgi:hypothetical protein